MNDFDDAIDVEDRLRAVKRAARRPRLRRRPALLASAGAAAATLFIYLHWRSARQHSRRRVGPRR